MIKCMLRFSDALLKYGMKYIDALKLSTIWNNLPIQPDQVEVCNEIAASLQILRKEYDSSTMRYLKGPDALLPEIQKVKDFQSLEP